MFKSLIFTARLLAFLKQKGFTHILKTGSNEEAQEFYMEAIKKGSRFLSDKKKRIFIEDINDGEFLDRVNGEIPLIEFFITIPVETYEKFINV